MYTIETKLGGGWVEWAKVAVVHDKEGLAVTHCVKIARRTGYPVRLMCDGKKVGEVTREVACSGICGPEYGSWRFDRTS